MTVEALANDFPPSDSMLDELALLVADMRQGNEQALESLYDATVGKLYALASAILRQADDAEDVVCATYAQAWETVASYDAQRASVLGWLLMICRSRALDMLRRRQARQEILGVI
jgi:RNA polymerase sigma-70 factor (ECF subfamily)